ncbi:TVP38/TMEM64 family protein [Paucibacter sp. KCTC 42545]|uniref:TVP38/TMEM64 family protein n=1 Tax=Paucibacter sp. KCTC 42545 TaxID=1768242 RepID=UPI000733AE61|nr:VTT domain-containing protein [Paucibacter sp. KCTC 42545]ALT79391.1 SNARE associated Golgi protein [Paucibacter sp. KCTC 42545]
MSRQQRLLLVLALLVAAWLALKLSGLSTQLFTLAELRALFDGHQGLGLLLFTLLFMAGNLLQIPGWIFLAAAVLALGPLWGGLGTYLAACCACLSSFVFIRGLGGDALRAWQNKGRLSQRLFARLDHHPLQSVTLLRLMFQTVPALNVALALSGVPWRSYALGTLIGLPLPIALYSLFFDRLALWLHLPMPS